MPEGVEVEAGERGGRHDDLLARDGLLDEARARHARRVVADVGVGARHARAVGTVRAALGGHPQALSLGVARQAVALPLQRLEVGLGLRVRGRARVRVRVRIRVRPREQLG